MSCRACLAALLASACGAGKPDPKLFDSKMDLRDSESTSSPSPQQSDDQPGANNAPLVRPKLQTERPAKKGEDDIESAPQVGPPIVTLPGFRMLDGGQSRVFVEVSGKVPTNETSTDKSVTIHLTGVMVPEKVNRMVLPTWGFYTPVLRARVEQAGDGADLVIELRAKALHATKIKKSPFGTRLVVDFAKPLQDDLDVAEKIPLHPDHPDARRHYRDSDGESGDRY